MNPTKSLPISKDMVWRSWLKVRANKGGMGVDRQSIEDFEVDIKNNLYKLWNRLASGSYFPPPVLGVEIPKKSGGVRLLGVPTVADRVAQMVVKDFLEPTLDPMFHENSYGYRPNKSTLDAVAITRQRCWKYPWLVEFDIKGLFDNIEHKWIIKALNHHCTDDWVVMYVKRWLTAETEIDGKIHRRTKGTPQGGVISPLLSNLFMHYAFDIWAEREFSGVAICRYADDGFLHCSTKYQAENVLKRLTERMQELGLEVHPLKTKIVYCRMAGRREKYSNVSFDFLGYTFRPRLARNKKGQIFLAFSPAVSNSSCRAMISKIRSWKIHFKVSLNLQEIAHYINPTLRGWANYYGRFGKTSLRKVWINLNWRLSKLLGKKYLKLSCKRQKSIYRLGDIARANPRLFHHWTLNCKPTATE